MESTEIQAISWWKGENSKSQFISGLKNFAHNCRSNGIYKYFRVELGGN